MLDMLEQLKCFVLKFVSYDENLILMDSSYVFETRIMWHAYHSVTLQADACHAYHIMLKHGIPEERVVLMMYDDIADNEL